MTINFHPVLSGDEEFLFSVYAKTRIEEMHLVDWNTTQKEVFLGMQLLSQDRLNKENYQGAEYQFILLNGQPIGRLYLQRWNDEIRIIDIALLPDFRGRWIGSNLLKGILEEATKNNLSVTVHMERFSPAFFVAFSSPAEFIIFDAVYLPAPICRFRHAKFISCAAWS